MKISLNVSILAKGSNDSVIYGDITYVFNLPLILMNRNCIKKMNGTLLERCTALTLTADHP